MSDRPSSGSSPPDAGADRLAAGLLLAVGTAHAALGIAGIAGIAAFEANVEEIEQTVADGLYASLAAWGALMLVLGIGELLAARAVWAGSPNGWLVGLISAFCGLGGAFFTLAIFRFAGVLTIALGFVAIYLLRQRAPGPGGT